MNRVSIAWRNFITDIRGSDGLLVVVTQTALILFLLTLSLTSASVQQYLTSNLNNMLGSDAVIETYQPLEKNSEERVSKSVQAISKTQIIKLTIAHGGVWQETLLKLVDDKYPLQGEASISYSMSGVSKPVRSGPKPGDIWLDSRLMSKLGVSVGAVINIAEVPLTVSAIIQHEPDRLMEGHSVAMRAIAHAASFIGREITNGKVRYRYLMTATSDQILSLEQWLSDNMPAAQLLKKQGGTHPLALFWKRTENFLGLASIILFFMAAVAIDMANRRHIKHQKRRISLYLSFGTPVSHGLQMSFLQWFFGFFVSVVLAAILTYFAQLVIMNELQHQFPAITSGWHLASSLKTILLLAVLLFSFQIPAFVQIAKTSITGLIRGDEGRSHSVVRLLWNFLSLGVLAAFYSDNALLTGLTLGAMGAALALMAVITWLLLSVGDWWGRYRPGHLPFVFFMMKQRLFSKTTQILGLGLCSLLLLFTLMLMKDLGDTMVRYTREHDGNLMIARAHVDHLPAINSWAKATDSTIKQLRPFANAQLVYINGKTLSQHSSKPSDSMATVKKPIRLSWADKVPASNKLADGTWWQEATPDWAQMSAEAEVITDLGLAIGDRLSFQVGNNVHEFRLVASHVFLAGKGSITFWFQVPLSAEEKIKPETYYMGSMELPEPAWPRLGELWQEHPTLSMAPLKELTKRFDDTLAIVTKLIVGFASMVLLMAAIVIAASIKGFQADDRRKNGLLMSMGQTKADCIKLSFYDWFITALISSVGAIAGTWIAGALIYESQFSMSYAPDFVWLGFVTLLISTVVCITGLLYCRHSLTASVTDLLNE